MSEIINYSVPNSKLAFTGKFDEMLSADIDAADDNGYSALVWSVIRGRREIVASLISKGCDVDKQTQKHAYTSAICASFTGQRQILEDLVMAGADINRTDNDGRTALIWAVKKKYTDVVLYLISQCDCDVNITTKKCQSALMYACLDGQKDYAIALLDAGALLNIVDYKGRSALMLACSEGHYELVLELLIISRGCSLDLKNHDGRSALMLSKTEEIAIALLEAGASTLGIENQIFQSSKAKKWNQFLSHFILSSCSNSDIKTGMTESQRAMWISVLTETNGSYVSEVLAVLSRNIDHLDLFLSLTDEKGRQVVDLATPLYKSVLLEKSLFLGRYELKKGSPEHVSDQCIVQMAVDHQQLSDPIVALKFMRNKSSFLREVNARRLGQLDVEFVVEVLETYDSDSNSEYCAEAKGRGKFPYCLVMKAGDRNLAAVLLHEHIAGRDWPLLKLFANQITCAVKHLHDKGWVHGDLKPLNIVRSEGRLRLIDLDGSCRVADKTFLACNCSSAYAPPEIVVLTADSDDDDVWDRPVLRGLVAGPEPLHAAFSYDMWALGAILYNLFTDETLFHTTSFGLMDDNQLQLLYDWTDSFKSERLSKIKNPEARNLVSRLLSKDPTSRPDASHVLAHPFLTGRRSARMVGEPPEYDIFLSYRVDSDFKFAEDLYDAFSKRGLKVWWDKKSLPNGKPWEEGFCDGLLKSRAFVAVVSRESINSSTVTRQNFSLLTEQSPCDNVLLEYRMALQLKSLGMLEAIYPVLIGDSEEDKVSPCVIAKQSTTVESDYRSLVFSSYFASGCCPSCPDVSVQSIESKLLEHFDRSGLGSPLDTNVSVKETLQGILRNQGGLVEGPGGIAFDKIVSDVELMVADLKSVGSCLSSPVGRATRGTFSKSCRAGGGGTGVHVALAAKTVKIEELTAENERLRRDLAAVLDRLSGLPAALQTAIDVISYRRQESSLEVICNNDSHDGSSTDRSSKRSVKQFSRTFPVLSSYPVIKSDCDSQVLSGPENGGLFVSESHDLQNCIRSLSELQVQYCSKDGSNSDLDSDDNK